ncbi:MAG TPA: ABC transporter permease [Chryseosolibacter sp.]|nr:ABC transporter permease [Chryseosolibacter sp.]
MISNYLKVVLRLITRQKSFAFLNIFGLTIGLIGFILIFLYVRYELTFNRHHEKLDRLHLVFRDVHIDNTTYHFTPVPYPFKDAIVQEFPEIEKATRYDAWNRFMFRYNEKAFDEPVLVADKELFDMFTFNFLEGNKDNPVPDAGKVAISKRIAEKYFGNEPAVGKSFQINGKHDVTVSSVYDNLPPNSSLQSDIILLMDFYKTLGWDLTAWNSNSTWVFVLLNENVDVNAFAQKLKPRLAKQQQSTDELYLHPYKDYYLHGFHYKDGAIKYVIIFAIIGMIVIGLAAINYVNLVTARSVKRAKEIGIRKSVGAQKSQVVFQFLSESILFALIALNFAVLTVELILPWFNTIINKKLSIEYTNPAILFSLIGIAVVVGLIAGAYPAFYLSKFSPASVLKSSEKLRGGHFKSALVIVQFSVSIALIIVSIILYKQFNHLMNLPIGFDKKNIFYFKLENEPRASFESLRKEFESLPDVISVGASSHLPTEIGSNGGGYSWEGKDPNQDVLISFTRVDDGYANTFGMEVKHGRFFQPGEIVIDTVNKISKIVVNEKLTEITGFADPVGKHLTTDSWRFEIIGVVKDFNFQQNQAEVGPLMMFYNPGATNFGVVKVKGDAKVVKGQLEKAYAKLFPQYPPSFTLMDDRFQQYFARENKNAMLFGYFTFLAIIISCLGLYGLASFIAEQRRKEMGIRKALGANTSGLSLLMLKDFAIWILISNIIAIPLAWYYANDQLATYTFKTEISMWIFVAAALLSILIAAATVIFQVLKTAKQNPAMVLKYE